MSGARGKDNGTMTSFGPGEKHKKTCLDCGAVIVGHWASRCCSCAQRARHGLKPDATEKTCSVCKEIKPIDDFYTKKNITDGHAGMCKKCCNEKKKIYRTEKSKEINQKQREFKATHPDKIRAYRKKHYANPDNQEKARLQRKKYAASHGAELYRRAKDRRSRDVNFLLASTLRHRLSQAVGANYKSGSAVRDLGCSIDELRVHLEGMFLPGMSWANWGKCGGHWNIDHIIPLAAADLTDQKQLLRVCHFSNLQPMWAIENIKKGARLSEGMEQ